MTTSDCLAAVLAADDVLLGLSAADKVSAIARLAHHAAGRLGIDASVIHATLMRREGLGSSGVGAGIALPHGSLDGLAAPFAALAILKDPVDFGAADETPVDVVFLLLTPAGKSGDHLPLMAAIARKCRAEGVLAGLRLAETPGIARLLLMSESQPGLP